LSKGLRSISTLSKGLLLHGNIKVLALTSLVTGVYVSMLNTILQPFVILGLGFSLPVLGVLQSVGSRPSGLASSIVQPFAGHLSDIVGRKPLIVAGSAMAICSMVSFLAAALTQSFIYLALGYFLFGLSLLSSPARQATIAGSVAMDPGKVEVAFSVVFFFTQVPGAFAPYVSVFLPDSLVYYVVFGAAALLELANLAVLVTLLKETIRPQKLGDGVAPNRFSLRQFFSLPPGFLKIFTPFTMDAFFFGIPGLIIYGMWVRQFGFSRGDIGLVVGTLSFSIVVIQYPAARFLKKVGTKNSLAFSEFLTVIVMLGWLLTSSLPVLILLSVVFGASVVTWVPAQNSLLMTSAPTEERGSVGGKLAAFRGLFAVPAPIIGGLLFAAYGYYLPVALGLVGEIFTTLAILRLLPKRLPARDKVDARSEQNLGTVVFHQSRD